MRVEIKELICKATMNMIVLRRSDHFQMELIVGIDLSVTANAARLGMLLVKSASRIHIL